MENQVGYALFVEQIESSVESHGRLSLVLRRAADHLGRALHEINNSSSKHGHWMWYLSPTSCEGRNDPVSPRVVLLDKDVPLLLARMPMSGHTVSCLLKLVERSGGLRLMRGNRTEEQAKFLMKFFLSH